MHIILAPSAIKPSRLNAYLQIANNAGPFPLALAKGHGFVCLSNFDEDSSRFDPTDLVRLNHAARAPSQTLSLVRPLRVSMGAALAVHSSC